MVPAASTAIAAARGERVPRKTSVAVPTRIIGSDSAVKSGWIG